MQPVPRPLALIPAYNESAHVAEVVRRSRAHVGTVLVVDDGSAARHIARPLPRGRIA